eukprot:TRINITY_DN16275_c0_g1_i1.p1 TRINITY_DN16275_c0_g1~~TRINITY_DN16275_c0_g1_i1.p1  ORF type:complete len:181 (+),score=27.49 TRINITY_DN16275_c0_g1_i1:55-543(+)
MRRATFRVGVAVVRRNTLLRRYSLNAFQKRAPVRRMFTPMSGIASFSSMNNSRFANKHNNIIKIRPARNNQLRWYSAAAALSESEVKQRVIRVVQEFHKVEENAVTETSHFTNDLGLDSLDQVELILALEDEFAIVISEADGETLQTVTDAYKYILKQEHAK